MRSVFFAQNDDELIEVKMKGGGKEKCFSSKNRIRLLANIDEARNAIERKSFQMCLLRMDTINRNPLKISRTIG